MVMEKYSQFRDRGSGIAPFFPVPSQSSGVYLPLVSLLFLVRFPVFFGVTVSYFLVLQWLPFGSLAKKAMLWLILGIPGIWWIDLQIDGVRRGQLARQQKTRLPQPSDIIASSFTSPIDSLYLAAIFDPIFTASYPHTRQVERISLLSAILRALWEPQESPAQGARLTDLRTLVKDHPNRIIAVFPECTTTNGRGILQFSPSLLAAPSSTKIFPVSLRYTPGDVTTPVPGAYWKFLWNLLSRHTHCIRVRIAESVHITSAPKLDVVNSYHTNFLDSLQSEDSAMSSSTDTLTSQIEQNTSQTADDRVLLEKIGDALARLGRVRRVGLDVKDKIAFVEAWVRHRRW